MSRQAPNKGEMGRLCGGNGITNPARSAIAALDPRLRRIYADAAVVRVADDRVGQELFSCLFLELTVTNAPHTLFALSAADPHADRLQLLHDAGLVWASALQGG